MKSEQATASKDSGQVSSEAAQVYEDFYVPALFAEWAPRVVQTAYINSGDKVLDVACGTGVVARYVEEQLQPGPQVIGIDLNEGMLAVAAGLYPEIKWDQGNAEALPYEDGKFDAVVCQFGLMFFEDRSKALKEMMRVLKPGRHMALAVWDTLEHAPCFAALVELLQQQFGSEVANRLRAPFALGDTKKLLSIFREAGIKTPHITTIKGQVQFPSIRSWIFTDVRGWAYSEFISDEQLEQLIAAAEEKLQRFIRPDEKVKFDISAHIVSAMKKQEE